jgi:NitT/TauT family transport system substrate-binding protein
MKRSTFTMLTGAVAGAATFARPAVAQPLTTIRLGTAPVESYALAVYASEHGFFRANGLDVQITTLNGGGAVMSAIAGGALDLACANIGAQANAHVRGLPFSMICPGGMYSTTAPTTVLAVGKNATIKTAHDLNGKTVGLSTLRDLQQASVMKWMDANGGDSSTLRFLEIPVPEMAPAIVAGRIDAATILEPSYTYAKNDIRVLGKCYDAIATRLMICTHFGSTDWLTKNPAPARAFVRAMRQAADWTNKHPRESASILATLTKIPVDVVDQMNRVTFGEVLDVSTMQPIIDAAAEYKFLPKTFPVSEMLWSGHA